VSPREIRPLARACSVEKGISYSFAATRIDAIRLFLISERANSILPSLFADFCEDTVRIGGMVGG
jgi:hypothetical protein